MRFIVSKKSQLFIVILLLAAGSVFAETPRLALVVGNAAYDGSAQLKNPANDARDIAAALEKVGWKVTVLIDVDRRGFNRAITAFRDALAAAEGSQALFYYAGHGMQVDGNNYLIPVKSEFETTDDVKNDAISMQSISTAIEQAKASVSLIILDACRDNPFIKTVSRSTAQSRGLSVAQNGGGTKGSAIMFSTSPGDVALDGTGRNGIFTQSLLKYIDSDLKIEDLFKNVTKDVREASAGNQKPWINASLSSDFFFVSDTIRDQRRMEKERAEEAARQAEIAKAQEIARQEAAAKAEKARLEAEAAKKAADQALAAQKAAEKAAAEQLAAERAESDKLRKQAEAALLTEKNKPKGKVRFESEDTGVVYQGGEMLGAIGPDSPLFADSLATGNAEFRFVSPGKPDEIKKILVTDRAYSTIVFGKSATKAAAIAAVGNFQEQTAVADPSAVGMIFVDADIAGAEVYVNGTLRGKAPVMVESIPAGNVLVEVKTASQYGSRMVNLNIKGLERIKLPMSPFKANLFFTSVQEYMTVFIDGKEFSQLGDGVIFGVPVGKHSIKVAKYGVLWQGEYDVAPNDTLKITPVYRPIGNLDLVGPENATVKLVHSKTGETIEEFNVNKTLPDLTSGTWNVTITGEVIDPWSGTVDVLQGETTRFEPRVKLNQKAILTNNIARTGTRISDLTQKLKKDKELRTANDVGGIIFTVLGLAAGGAAGYFYYDASQAYDTYSSAGTSSAATLSRNQVEGDMKLVLGCAIGGGVAALFSLIFAASDPWPQKTEAALSAEQKSLLDLQTQLEQLGGGK